MVSATAGVVIEQTRGRIGEVEDFRNNKLRLERPNPLYFCMIPV
jgi:hypothetical protein